MASWLKDVETALAQLGGAGNVNSITEKVKGVRFFSKNKNFHNAVSATLHSNKHKFEYYGDSSWRLLHKS